MRTIALLLCLAAMPVPRQALAHGNPPIAFVAPVGPGNVVERGTPFEVSWFDPDIYPDDLLTLRIRATPPSPYIPFWPVEQIEGEPVAPAISMADGANRLELSTTELAPGHWFFWFDVIDPTLTARYVPPAGVLTVVEPGEAPPPSIWFDAPQSSTGASGESFEVVYSTFPTDGVTVELSGSLNDLEGLDLVPLRGELPGGTRVSETLSLHCVADGAFGVFATVRDEAGREGSAFATGRISWRRPDGEALPADCPSLQPDEEPAAAPDEGGPGCSCGAGGKAPPPLEALLVLVALFLSRCAARTRGPARPCQALRLPG